MLLLGNTDPSKAVAWDTNDHLTFAVPFQDMKPNINLGRITQHCRDVNKGKVRTVYEPSGP